MLTSSKKKELIYLIRSVYIQIKQMYFFVCSIEFVNVNKQRSVPLCISSLSDNIFDISDDDKLDLDHHV